MRHLLEARPEPLPQPLDIVAIVAVDLSAVSPTRSGKTGETGSQQTTSTRVHSDGERSHKQEAIDPGHYAFTTIADNAVELSASMVLKSYRDTTTPELTVKRRIEIVQPPLQHPIVRSVGVRLAHEITFAPETTDGIVDAWQILQVRPGSRLVAPMARPEQPLAYGPTGRWQAGQDNVTWDFTGTESAKFGLSNAASTGRAASISPGSHGQLEMIVRDFEVRRDCAYADHPFGTPRNDQIFQAWDGFGFGELEVRSPALDASRQRTLVDESSIWIFAGPEAAVREIGRSLLAPNALPLASTSN